MSPDFLIVGAGMSGSAIAAQLSSVGSVVVLEQGDRPASEAAAQNAGLIRRLDAEPCDRALAQRTFRFLRDEAPAWDMGELSRETGAVVGMVRDPLWLHNARAHLDSHGIAIQAITPSDIPALDGSPIQHAWHLPDERTCDAPSLARAMLKRATDRGAEVRCNEAAVALVVSNGRVTGVRTSTAELSAGRVILAGGAWAGRLAETGGIHRPLFPLRRTAGLIKADLSPSPSHPWVWLDDVGVYAKPDGPHWTISPCNERLVNPPIGPGSTEQPSEEEWAMTRTRVGQYFPALGSVARVRAWTGLRTFAPDRRPLIGEDAELPGLWWASGLGGSGVSSCWGVGEAITAWIQGHSTGWLEPSSVAPHRDQLRRWPIYPTGDPGRARLISG